MKDHLVVWKRVKGFNRSNLLFLKELVFRAEGPFLQGLYDSADYLKNIGLTKKSIWFISVK